MSHGIQDNYARRDRRQDLLLIFAVALGFRLALLLLFPVPYGNDAAGRLYFRDTLWIGHWLPVTQALVYAGFAGTHSVVFVRVAFSVLTSFSAVAFTFYLQLFASRPAAVAGGLLFATNSLLVFLSLMPYQEVIFIGLLFGGLAFFHKSVVEKDRVLHFVCGSLLYGLACLTRYEAWFILPALWLAFMWRRFVAGGTSYMLMATSKITIALAWAPALWMFINWLKWGSATAYMFHRPDHEFYAWAPHAEVFRIANYAGLMLYWLGRFGSPLVLLALPGAWVFWKNRRALLPVLWPVLLLLSLVLIFLIFVAGREFATANRFASLPLAITLIFVSLGAAAMLQRIEQSRAGWLTKFLKPLPKTLLGVAALLLLLVYGAVPVVHGNSHPEFREAYEVAAYLEAHLLPDERAVLIAESIDGAVPMPYQRVFGQLTFDKERLLCAALLEPQAVGLVSDFVRSRRIRYIAVFGGPWARTAGDRLFEEFLASGSVSKTVAFRNNVAILYDVQSPR